MDLCSPSGARRSFYPPIMYNTHARQKPASRDEDEKKCINMIILYVAIRCLCRMNTSTKQQANREEKKNEENSDICTMKHNEIYENFLHPQHLELITFAQLDVLVVDDTANGNNFYEIVRFKITIFGGTHLTVVAFSYPRTGNVQSLHILYRLLDVSRHSHRSQTMPEASSKCVSIGCQY